ncbi:LytR C-terminal domain-containing protein [Blastococcus sp. VKM Ac-2987]|uniref:LytR C-terminal domain-containing protein n=1 Tax=Blastococcus sp. VKM Ac-2987 TaxID=3004141 RepID=UPI0022AB98F6|nr:LytR C-terminal domain-containing protein [Blastococcus sp. VKM Ac-2987]MCZ2858261.1 LytR C-terminal domain-containing protein [Blastococcus sp. VKM Ac-2987]
MGRHAASGSDELGQGNGSATAGRRRTDAPDRSWSGGAAQLSDHPTAPGRERAERRRDVLLDASAGDGGRQVSRSRLPLPPVPVGARPAGGAPAPRPAPALAPQTSAAPFLAVPHPEPREESAAPARGADVLAPAAGDALFGAPAGATGRPASSVLVDDGPLVTTGPSGLGGRTAAPRVPRVPRVPRQTAPSSAPPSSYGDWTKPSRTEDTGRSRIAADAVVDVLRTPLAPATTAIPERGTTTRRDEAPAPEDDLDAAYGDPDDRATDDNLSGTGPVKGGRAAYRAERQAADAARRKAAKRNGTPEVLFDDEPERKPRRVLKGLVAMAVVAGAVLGVYQVTAPAPEEAAAAQSAPAPVSTPTVAPPSAALPPLTLEPVPVEPAVTTPVRVPVTVLNATSVTGLAGKISGAVVAGGWESPGVGAYPGTDVAATTVFFTEGDEQQRQAALQLIDQFPELAGPAPRFFEVTDVPAPGLVVVATGNWQP